MSRRQQRDPYRRRDSRPSRRARRRRRHRRSIQRVDEQGQPAHARSVGDFTIEGWTNLTSASTTNNTLYGTLGAVRLLVRPGTSSTPTTAYAGVWLNGIEYVLQRRQDPPNRRTATAGSTGC